MSKILVVITHPFLMPPRICRSKLYLDNMLHCAAEK